MIDYNTKFYVAQLLCMDLYEGLGLTGSIKKKKNL